MKDRSDDPSHHEWTFLPWSMYILCSILAGLGKKLPFLCYEYFSLSLCGVFCCGFLMGFLGDGGWGGFWVWLGGQRLLWGCFLGWRRSVFLGWMGGHSLLFWYHSIFRSTERVGLFVCLCFFVCFWVCLLLGFFVFCFFWGVGGGLWGG